VRHKDKPYRVYRGGRVKGPVRPLRHDGAASEKPRPEEPERGFGSVATVAPPEVRTGLPPELPPLEPEPRRRRERPPRRRGRRIAFWALIVLLLLLLATAGWGAFGYLSFRSGVKDANRRLDERAVAALSPQSGSLLSSPSNILVLGIDTGASRKGDQGRSDAIMVVHTDPDHHRLAYLSIPRDLRVEIPGSGQDKINAAYAYGGSALAIRTVENVLGEPINHVVVVDFATFPEVIDALGGVTIDVPKPIRSNKFDCPFPSRAECDRWKGWRFAAGKQTMNGRRALVYARIRENLLDPSETDLTRASRQQQVLQAIASEVASPKGFFRLPFFGKDLVKPLATDLSAAQLLQLGWVEFRAAEDSTLRCRLGGEPETIDGVFYLLGDAEQNVGVISMALGQSAPQPPPPGQPFAAGCRVAA
jgi:LCP family protein required for cell wall assembly